MDEPLDLNYFNFCPLEQRPVLGMLCAECMFLEQIQEEHFCTYLRAQANGEFIAVKTLVIHLLDYLEEGRTHLTKEELLDFFTDRDRDNE